MLGFEIWDLACEIWFGIFPSLVLCPPGGCFNCICVFWDVDALLLLRMLYSFFLFHFPTSLAFSLKQSSSNETLAQFAKWSQLMIDYFFANLTYRTVGFRSSNVAHNGYQYTTAASGCCQHRSIYSSVGAIPWRHDVTGNTVAAVRAMMCGFLEQEFLWPRRDDSCMEVSLLLAASFPTCTDRVSLH